jgi:hypothetical protein
MTESEAVLFGIPWLDDRAHEHLTAGRTAEALHEYASDLETVRRVRTAAESAGATITADTNRAIDERSAHALHNMGKIEAVLLRTGPALDHTAEGLRIYRKLNSEQADTRIRSGLVAALWSFAMVRALCRTAIPEAADAVAEAIGLQERLTAQEPGTSDELLAQLTRMGQQIQELLRREWAGEPLGILGSSLPDSFDWREQLWLTTLENLEVEPLLQQLGNAEQAVRLLRGLDARGDPEGARKLGILLFAQGDVEGAEAAFRRGDERGSVEAPFYLGMIRHQRGDLSAAEFAYRRAIGRGSHLAAYNLGQLLKTRGDVDGARTAFEKAAESDDTELAADAQRELRKGRRRWWPRRSGPPRR